jgi:hypothetical protein
MLRKLTAIETARAVQYGLIACCFTLALVVIAYGH